MMAERKSGGCFAGRCSDAAQSVQRNTWEIEPMPFGLEDSPLDFLFADHHRQRQAVQILLAIAGGGYNEDGVRNLIRFLERDFALHIQDEEQNFVPLLLKECPAEDGIDALVDRLADDHADDRSSVRKVIRILQDRLHGNRLNACAEAAIRAFAVHLQQHLAIENGVLLPIARVRMSADALNALAQAIRKRREQCAP